MQQASCRWQLYLPRTTSVLLRPSTRLKPIRLPVAAAVAGLALLPHLRVLLRLLPPLGCQLPDGMCKHEKEGSQLEVMGLAKCSQSITNHDAVLHKIDDPHLKVKDGMAHR